MLCGGGDGLFLIKKLSTFFKDIFLRKNVDNVNYVDNLLGKEPIANLINVSGPDGYQQISVDTIF